MDTNDFKATPLESIELGVAYPHEWGKIVTASVKKTAWLQGDTTIALIEDGKDLAILQKSLTSGEQKLIHLEDLKPLDVHPVEKSPEHFMRKIIENHRAKIGAKIFESFGLEKKGSLKDSEKYAEMIFLPNEEYKLEATFLGNYGYFFLKFHKNHWKLELNLNPNVSYKQVKWDDEASLLALVDLTNQETLMAEVELSLKFPDKALIREEAARSYERNRKYLLDEVPLEAFKEYANKVFLRKYPGVSIKIAFWYVGEESSYYPKYPAAIRIALHDITFNGIPSDLDSESVLYELVEGLNHVGKAFEIGIVYAQDGVALATKYPEDFKGNTDKVFDLVLGFTG